MNFLLSILREFSQGDSNIPSTNFDVYQLDPDLELSEIGPVLFTSHNLVTATMEMKRIHEDRGIEVGVLQDGEYWRQYIKNDDVAEATDWIGSAKTHAPDHLFSDGSISEIVKWALSAHSGDSKRALASLSFFLNRNSNISSRIVAKVEAAKDIIKRDAELAQLK
jgi:hypothetical protein